MVDECHITAPDAPLHSWDSSDWDTSASLHVAHFVLEFLTAFHSIFPETAQAECPRRIVLGYKSDSEVPLCRPLGRPLGRPLEQGLIVPRVVSIDHIIARTQSAQTRAALFSHFLHARNAAKRPRSS